MSVFLFELVFMYLGALFVLFFRAFKEAGTAFELHFWINDNRFRLVMAFGLLALAQSIVFFQPGFIEGIRATLAPYLPEAAQSSAVGAVLMYALIKGTKTTSAKTEDPGN